MIYRFLSFFALYFALGFASPLLIILANREDFAFNPGWFSLASLLIILVLSSASCFLSNKTRFAHAIATASLTCALVFAIQGNIVHDLFFYGNFSGNLTNWRLYGWKFWLEWIAFLLAFPLFFLILIRLQKIPVWLTLIPILSSLALVTPAIFKQQDHHELGLVNNEVEADVFEFSSELNLVHLLPDGFQGDIAREVLDDHPLLAGRLAGFTLYRNHVGMYQGTAPAVATILTGQPFDFMAGYSTARIIKEIGMFAYPGHLHKNGFRVDQVMLSYPYCTEGAASCVFRPFNDLKPRGYFRYRNVQYAYAARLLFDLTLFRHLPMFLKENVYNNGNWLLADTTLDGSSPWPDPVLREWTDNMVVADPQPRYKWYHYIGTHVPPRWDANCDFNRELERTRQQYYEQTICILTGIADFADKLRELGIYDQTAIIISGDHGINIMPDDHRGLAANGSAEKAVLGGARPALLLKPLHSRELLNFSDLPSSLIDIAPTALDLVGLDYYFPGQSLLSLDPAKQRTRVFKWYNGAEFWSGNSISHQTWYIEGDVQDGSNWSLQDLYLKTTAPSAYPAINFNSVYTTSRGISLDPATPDAESAWIGGSEFSILLGCDQADLPGSIELELSLPEFMNAETQSFTVSLNHKPLPKRHTLKYQADWVRFEIKLPNGLLKQGNNLFTFKFSETAMPVNRTDWRAAGKIKSLRLVQ